MVKKKDILTVVGDNIRQIRMAQGVSQNQLAFEAGVTREFINKVESGKNNISVKNLEKIADILEVDIKDLFNL